MRRVNGASTYCDLSITFHYTDLDVFRSGLHDLQKTLYRKLDTLVARHVIFVILLQELADSFGRSSDSVRLTVT